MKAILIFSNKGSNANRRMLKFVDDALDSIIKAGISFDFQIAYPEDKDHYDEQGIKLFPHFQIGDTNISNSDKIIAYLTDIIKKSNEKKKIRAPTDDVHDFMMDSLGKQKKDSKGNLIDDEEDDDGMGDFRGRVSSEMERRGISNQQSVDENPRPRPPSISRDAISTTSEPTMPQVRSSRPSLKPIRRPAVRQNNIEQSTSAVLDSMSSRGESGSDDALMSKFFANQETTSI